MSWLTWQVRRELKPSPADPVNRAYDRLCRRLGSIGIPRMPHEGAEAFAARVSRLRPDLAAPVTALCREYSRLCYGAPPSSAATGFPAAVRKFRPRGFRGSS
jgi:hypothetical protein